MTKSKCSTKKPRPPRDEWTTTPLEGSSKGPYPPDISDLQRRIKENPLSVAAEARYKLGEVQAGYRRDLYAVLAMIVGIARHYYFDYKAWKPFFSLSFFQTGKHKPKARTHHTDALRHTMNYVFDAKSKQARSRTGKYAAALHQIMITGVPVHLVAEEIEREGGIEKLYQAYLEREAHKPKRGQKQIMSEADFEATNEYHKLDKHKASTADDVIFGDLEDGGEPDVDDGGAETEGVLDIYEDAEAELCSVRKRGSDPTGRPTIELEMNEARQERFLGLKKGQRAIVHVTCRGVSEDEWLRLRATKVRWLAD